MKKLILPLSLLFIVLLNPYSYAGDSTPVLIRDACPANTCEEIEADQLQLANMSLGIVGGSVPAAGDYCASCDPGDPADVLCEQFGTYCTTDSGWTEVIQGDNSITVNAAAGANWECTNLGEYVVEIDVSDSTWDDFNYIYFDHGAGLAEWHVKIYLRFTSSTLSDESNRLFNLGTTTAGPIWGSIKDVGGQLQLSSRCDSTDSVVQNISLSTDYELVLNWVSGTSATIDFGEPGSTSQICSDTTSVAAASPQYFALGRWAGVADATYTVEILGVIIDDDTEPTDCTE